MHFDHISVYVWINTKSLGHGQMSITHIWPKLLLLPIFIPLKIAEKDQGYLKVKVAK